MFPGKKIRVPVAYRQEPPEAEGFLKTRPSHMIDHGIRLVITGIPPLPCFYTEIRIVDYPRKVKVVIASHFKKTVPPERSETSLKGVGHFFYILSSGRRHSFKKPPCEHRYGLRDFHPRAVKTVAARDGGASYPPAHWPGRSSCRARGADACSPAILSRC